MPLSLEKKLRAYYTMVLIRRFEEKTQELYQKNLIGGSLHVYTGQEAVAVGACMALRTDDYITMTYRSRGQMLAKGADPSRTMAEILGRTDGYCKGKGGPMHLTDVEHGILGANGIVAAGIPIAVGAALSAKMRETDQVGVAFFGDGATNQGAFHEALNLAAVWDLPAIFICENNLYAEMTPQHDSARVERLSDRAAAYGFPGVTVDGMDVAAVHEAMEEAVSRCRAGGGPVLIECLTYRFTGHMLGDPEVYRGRDEVETWRQRDPIVTLREQIAQESPDSESELDGLEAEAIRVVEEAEAFALASPEPGPEELTSDIWV